MATTLTRRIGFRYGQIGCSSLVMSASLTTAPPVSSSTALLTCPTLSANTGCVATTLTIGELILNPDVYQSNLLSYELELIANIAVLCPVAHGECFSNNVVISAGVTTLIQPTGSGTLASSSITVSLGGYTVTAAELTGQLTAVDSTLTVSELLLLPITATASYETIQVDILAYVTVAPVVTVATLSQDQLAVSPSSFIHSPELLTAYVASYSANLISSSSLLVSTATGSFDSASVVVNSGGLILGPVVTVASVECATIALIIGELAVPMIIVTGQLSVYDVYISASELNVVPSAIVGSMAVSDVTVAFGETTYAVSIAVATTSTTAATVTPGNIEILVTVLTSEIAYTNLSTVVSPILLETGVLPAYFSCISAGVDRRLVLGSLVVTGETKTSHCDIQATLALALSRIDSLLACDSAELSAVLSLTLDTLTITLLTSAITAVPGDAIIAAGNLTAIAESTSLVVIASYFGIYADTPFVATTGSMFE